MPIQRCGPPTSDRTRNDGLKGIELELATLGSKSHGDVVSKNLERHLVDDLRDIRIDPSVLPTP
jgi:hypothetical protein